MAFTRTPAANNTAESNSAAKKVGGYLNINIVGRDGTRKRLGTSGIALRETHPVEAAILDYCRKNPEAIQDLVGRIELSFGEATKEGDTFDLGL